MKIPVTLRHFAIPADDVERARAFYAAVFGWRFVPYGPPGFYQIDTGSELDETVQGALQRRTEPAAPGGMTGFECTFGVADLDETLASIERAGGRQEGGAFEIGGVGTLAFARDTEGNRFGVMRYLDTDAAPAG